MKIGTRCRIINATVAKNDGLIVIIVGDAGVRHINSFGETQCYYIDRDLQTRGGLYRNWTSEIQLEPIDNLVTIKSTDKAVCNVAK